MLFLLLLIPLALALGYYVGRRDLFPIPLVDRYSVVVPTATPAEWIVTLRALENLGLKPRLLRCTDFALRALYPGGLIVNYTRHDAYQNLGEPTAGIIVVKRRPNLAIQKLAMTLRNRRVILDPEPELPKGRMAFLRSGDLGKLLVGCRRYALAMGGKRPEKFSWWAVGEVVTRMMKVELSFAQRDGDE